MTGQSGVSPEVVPLPKGGGATRGIGDAFTPDLHTGNGHYRVPLQFPPGPGGLRPEMDLVYATGQGNGPLGIGWTLPILRIARDTDRALPTYDHDTFLLDGEELVSIGGGRYRHRRDVRTHRVERLADGWEVRDRGGRRFLLGHTSAGRLTSPEGDRVQAWLVERVTDLNGNEIGYGYKEHAGVPYLENLTYGPFTVRFHYEARPDPFTDRRPGFPVRTELRCRAIAFHLDGDAQPFQRYEFGYDACPHAGVSLLTSVTLTGQRAGPAGVEAVSLPTLRLGYAPFSPEDRMLRAIHSEVDMPPPGWSEGGQVDLVDLDGKGLPGVLELRGPIRRYWPNRGLGRWGAPRTLRDLPSHIDLSNPALAVADMNGDGAAELIMMDRSPVGYYRGEAGRPWTRRERFRQAPTFDPASPDLRFVDLNGDGTADAVRTGQRLLYLHYNDPQRGWSTPTALPRIRDSAVFPDVSLGDPRVRLADMTGDGLTDIVRVHGGRIEYWPHHGHGRFGHRVTLPLAPSIGHRIDPARLLLGDVNGDGVTDIVYVDEDRVRVWINQCGNVLARLPDVRHTPPPRAGGLILADLFGTGASAIVWSAATARAPHYTCLDLTGGTRPYLLTTIDDGTGRVTEIEYSSSSDEAVRAVEEGRPWTSSIPFPVHIVTRITERDMTTGIAVSRAFTYRDGHFDAHTRTFRGFGVVEVLDEGDAEAPSTRSVHTFHQGDPSTPSTTRDERIALTGRLASLEVWDPDNGGRLLRREDNVYAVRRVGQGTGGEPILFPHLVLSTVAVHEGTAAAVSSTTAFTYDDLGNVVRKHERWDVDGGQQDLLTEIRYTVDTDQWILNLPVEVSRRDGAGVLIGLQRFYYDGNPFTGLPLGQVHRGNLSRREDLVLTDGLVAAVHGGDSPDLAGLGYHVMSLPGGGTGWGVNAVRESHDDRGNVRGRMGPRGDVGWTEYDVDGIHSVRVTNPLGHEVEVDTDPRHGNVVHLREANGHETSYRYDPVGRLVAVVKPGDSDALPTVTFRHDDHALPLSVRTRTRIRPGDPEVMVQVEYFDGWRRLLQRRTNAEGGQVLVDGWRRYNSRGWEVERSPPFLSTGLAFVPGEGATEPHKYRFRHDALGRVVETWTPDGRPSRTIYGPGTVTRYDVSDTDGSPEGLARGHFDTPRTECHDAKGRLIAVVERLGDGTEHETRYTHDCLGHLTYIRDARGVDLATYDHDLLGRKVRVVHIDAGTRRVVYDARGDLVGQMDTMGRRSEFRHDALGRQTEVRVDGAVVERYTYDAGTGDNLVGRLARVVDEAGEVRFSYGPRGLIRQRTRDVATMSGPRSFTLAFEHDSMERMTVVTHPGGAPVRYRYNQRSLVQRIEGVVDEIAYNALGQPTRVRYANGVEEIQEIDDATFRTRETRIQGPVSADPYHHVAYTYDSVGNPTEIQDLVTTPGHPTFQRRFVHDALHRLTKAEGELGGAPFAHDYTHDPAGNLLLHGEAGPDPYYLEGTSNRVRGVVQGGAQQPRFVHDANGNLTATPELASLEYDARGRLVRVTLPDGAVVETTYGFDGERVRRRVTRSGNTRETVYVNELYELREGRATRFVFHGDVRVAALSDDGSIRFFHRDGVGSVVLVTDEAGAVAQRLGYNPFGTLAFSQGDPATDHTFIGNEWDPDLGLLYCGSRYYHPGIGRFISPDPYILLQPEEALLQPVLLNPYAYAMNNPVRLADSEGTWWKWLVGGLVIAALVVATVAVGIATGGAGFAFGILLAASIGSALGSGIGVYSAWRGGGDLGEGFMFGAIMGGAAGAAGYAAGALVGTTGISGVWGSILVGAAEGALIGAGNGAIIGYAGGAGSVEDVFLNAAVGFAVGAALGGLAGYWSQNPPLTGQSLNDAASKAVPGPHWLNKTGEAVYKGHLSQHLAPVAQGIAQAGNSVIQALAVPTFFASLGSIAHLAVYYHWDDIRPWILETFGEGESQEVIIPASGSY